MSGIWGLSYGVLWALVLAEAVFILVLFRQLGLRSLSTPSGISRDGLAIGSRIPELQVPSGAAPSADGANSLLVFVSTGCRPCRELMPELDAFLDDMDDRVKGMVIVARDDADGDSGGLHSRTAVVVRDLTAGDRFKIRVTPFAYLVGSDGRVRAKGLVNHRNHLSNLLRSSPELWPSTGRD